MAIPSVSGPGAAVMPQNDGNRRPEADDPGAPGRHAGAVLPRARGCFHAERTRSTP